MVHQNGQAGIDGRGFGECPYRKIYRSIADKRNQVISSHQVTV